MIDHDDFDDDITDDLTVDGADLLAELQAEHAKRAASDELSTDELSIDGRELLAELQAEVRQDACSAPWRPVPDLPAAEMLATPRAGGPSGIQLVVIGLVSAIAVLVGGWMIYDVVTDTPADTPVDGTAEAETE